MRAQTISPGSRGQRLTRLKVRQLLAVIAIVVVALGAGYIAYARSLPAPAAVTSQLFAVRLGTLTSSVSATGSVVSTGSAKLSFKTSGKVSEVLVQVGDSVAQDQALAKLDWSELQTAVTRARAQLVSAEAKLALIEQGSRPEELAAAESSLASAQASFAEVRAGATSADILSAQAAVAAAKSNLAAARASLAALQSQPKPEDVKTAQLQLEQAKNSLWSAQIGRDGTCHGGGKEYQCDAANLQVAAAEKNVANAQVNLDAISQPASAAELQSAREAVAGAQAAYDGAVAKLKQVQAGSTAADTAAAQAAVSSAQSQLATKRTPYTTAEIQEAQSGVDQAKAALALAQYEFESATLVAPFTGMVSAVAMNPGEASGSGAITLVDPKALRIDATVDESDIGKLALGQDASITFDALSGRTFQGKVIAIAPSGTVLSGVVTYVVSLSVDNPDGLKAGMTANASVVTASKDNVLLVPNRALQAQGRSRVVNVVVDGKTQVRAVQVGLSNDRFTEVTEGLNEGDEVLISSTTTTTPRVNTGGVIMGGGALGGPPPGGMGR